MVPLFMMWNHDLIHTSLAFEISWECISAFTFSIVRCFHPLTCFAIWESSFYQACLLSETVSGRRSGFALILALHCFPVLTDSVNATLQPFSHIFGQNHDLSSLFFLMLPDHWSTTPFSIIYAATSIHLRRNLPP